MTDSKQEATSDQKKGIGFKTKLKLLFWLVIIVGIAFGWWYGQRLLMELKQARQINAAYQIIREEKERCGSLLQQQMGDFAEYEYCRRLLEKF